MENKEKEYLQAKISRRLSSIKTLVDYQLNQYAKYSTFDYKLLKSMEYILGYMNDIKIADDKISKGY